MSSLRQLATDQPDSSNDLVSHKAFGWSGFWWLSAVGLIAVVLCLPFIRYVSWLGDEGVLLHGAERMLQGDRLYLDFFEFLPPGGFIITEAWFAMAGISMFAARALAILTIGGIACFTYLACRQASKHAPLSAFIAVGWVVISEEQWTQINHHWFTTLFSMMAAWATLVSVERAQPWLRGPLVAGVAAGEAVMVTPTRGAFATLAAATAFLNLRQYRAELMGYLLGSALAPISLIAYLIGHDALAAAFDDVVLFTAKHYMSIAPVPFGLGASIYQKLLFPLAALVALPACFHDRHKWFHDRMLRTCAAFGLAGFAGCFPRPDGPHIGFAAPLVCPLLAYSINRLTRPWPAKCRYAAALLRSHLSFPLPAGFGGPHMQPSIRRSCRCREGAYRWFRVKHWSWWNEWRPRHPTTRIFFYPYMPMLPFLTVRRHVSKYDVFTPDYTLPFQYQEACVSVMRNASWVVIDRNWTSPKFLTTVLPAMRDPEPRDTKRFEQALETGFELVGWEGSFETRRRRVPAVDESVRAGIAE